jgi:hypothetical protein
VKNLPPSFCKYMLAALLFLSVPVLGVYAQQPELSDETQSKQSGTQIFNPFSFKESSVSPSKLETKHLFFRRASKEDSGSSVNHSSAPPQTASGGYVFPSEHERFNRYLWDTFGPLRLIGVAAAAGIDYGYNEPPEWKKGGSGYGKRFASRMGQNVIEQTTSYALSEAFRLDTGFTRSQRHGFSERLGDALIQNVTSRTRSGKRIISAPRLVGVYVGGLVPVLTWYPDRFSYKDGLRMGTYSLAAGFVGNVLREFIFH